MAKFTDVRRAALKFIEEDMTKFARHGQNAVYNETFGLLRAYFGAGVISLSERDDYLEQLALLRAKANQDVGCFADFSEDQARIVRFALRHEIELLEKHVGMAEEHNAGDLMYWRDQLDVARQALTQMEA